MYWLSNLFQFVIMTSLFIVSSYRKESNCWCNRTSVYYGITIGGSRKKHAEYLYQPWVVRHSIYFFYAVGIYYMFKSIEASVKISSLFLLMDVITNVKIRLKIKLKLQFLHGCSKLDALTISKTNEFKSVIILMYWSLRGILPLVSLKLNVNNIPKNNHIIGPLLLLH